MRLPIAGLRGIPAAGVAGEQLGEGLSGQAGPAAQSTFENLLALRRAQTMEALDERREGRTSRGVALGRARTAQAIDEPIARNPAHHQGLVSPLDL
jgi:hypothetical protein